MLTILFSEVLVNVIKFANFGEEYILAIYNTKERIYSTQSCKKQQYPGTNMLNLPRILKSYLVTNNWKKSSKDIQF